MHVCEFEASLASLVYMVNSRIVRATSNNFLEMTIKADLWLPHTCAQYMYTCTHTHEHIYLHKRENKTCKSVGVVPEVKEGLSGHQVNN